MKPHRQIRTSKRVGDPSSQYGLQGSLDYDYADKKEVIEWAEDKIFSELEKLITNKISYQNGTMTQEQKWCCIVNASLKLKEKYDL